METTVTLYMDTANLTGVQEQEWRFVQGGTFAYFRDAGSAHEMGAWPISLETLLTKGFMGSATYHRKREDAVKAQRERARLAYNAARRALRAAMVL